MSPIDKTFVEAEDDSTEESAASKLSGAAEDAAVVNRSDTNIRNAGAGISPSESNQSKDSHPLHSADSPLSLLERLSEATGVKPPSPEAIAQSNDYAKNHKMSGKLEDGFRSAGQFREFAPDGTFAATDRAATVVDRSRDQKLNQIIEEARKQFGDLPPRERAKALAEYVNKVMGPQDGDEKALDARYRQLMKDNAGKEMLLSEFLGSGACTQRAMLLKVLADELGLDSSIVRGNGGSHVWNTFKFEDGKEEIFDTRARQYGLESSPMHRPNSAAAESINGYDYSSGQKVTVDGKEWTVSGTDSKTGKIGLSHDVQRAANQADVAALNPGKELVVGQKYKLPAEDIYGRGASRAPGSNADSTNEQAGRAPTDILDSGKIGSKEEWTFEGKNPDGTLRFSRREEKSLTRKELSDSVLEMAGPSADMQYLKDNWKKLVEDNSKLTDKQRQDLAAARDALDGNAKLGDFRKLLDEIGKQGTSSGADASARVNALTKIANTMANYPDAVNLPIERVIGAGNVEALTQVAESLAQSAPHDKPPLTVDGQPEKTGNGYEHYAGLALQEALKDKAAMEKLVRDGKLPPGDWVFVSASKGSVADHLKIDGMLVDMKTGKAVFVDFAMHGTGRTPYGKLVEKISPNDRFRDGTARHPFALTLDLDTIAWDPNTGKPSGGKIDSAKILERVGHFMNGTQAEAVGITSFKQAKPPQFDIARLRADLGVFPSFGPVNGKLEADVLSRESGKPVKTTQQELLDIESKAGRRTDLRFFANAANNGSNAAEDVANGANFFDNGLRAAVEAEKYGALDKAYGDGKKVPEVKLRVGQDSHADLPDKYQGKKYISVTGDDTVGSNGGRREATEVRIYENGDIVVKPGGGKFHCIGNVKDVGERLARELQRNGVDPRNFSQQIKELGRLSKNFNSISADIKAIEGGTMTPEAFWNKHKELRILADGVQHGEANQRAAQEARPVYEARQAIDRNQALASLPAAQKDAIAERIVALQKAGEKKFSLENVRDLIQLEKGGMKAAEALDAIRLQRALGKEAESWSVADIKAKYESAKAAQVKDFVGVKELADVYRMQKMQTDMSVDAPTARALFGLKKLLPEASNADLLSVKQQYDAMRTAGMRSTTLDSAAAVFSKYGKLTDAEIKEMAKLGGEFKKTSPEDLAGLARRNLQVESQYKVDQSKADAIRAKAGELLKAGIAPEFVHDAAALMTLKNMDQAAAVELAKKDPGIDNTRKVEMFGAKPGADPVVDSLALETEYKQFRKWSSRGRAGLDASSGGLYQARVNQLINRGLPSDTNGKTDAFGRFLTDFARGEPKMKDDPLLSKAKIVADPSLENGGKVVFKYNGVEVTPVCRDATHAYLRSANGETTKVPLAEMEVEMRVSAKTLAAAGNGTEAAKKAAREVSSTLFHELGQLEQLSSRLERGKAEGVDLLSKTTSNTAVRQFLEREKMATDLSANFMQYELNGRRLVDSQAVPHATPVAVDLRTPLSEIKGQKVVTAMEPDGRLRIYVIDSKSTVKEIEGDKARELVEKAFDKMLASLDEKIKNETDEAVKKRLIEERQRVLEEKERYAKDTEYRRSVNHELGKRMNSMRDGVGRVTGPAVTVLFLTTVALELFRRENHGSSDFLDITPTGS